MARARSTPQARGCLGALPLTTLKQSALLRDARRIAGRDDGDAGPFGAALQALVASLEKDARLNFIGRLVIRRHLVRNFSNALRLDEELARDPGLAAERIRRPLFIVGSRVPARRCCTACSHVFPARAFPACGS